MKKKHLEHPTENYVRKAHNVLELDQTIGEAVDLILKHTGHNVKPVYDTSKPVTIQYRALNTDKAKRILNYNPKVSFEEGIKKTIEWIRKEMETE